MPTHLWEELLRIIAVSYAGIHSPDLDYYLVSIVRTFPAQAKPYTETQMEQVKSLIAMRGMQVMIDPNHHGSSAAPALQGIRQRLSGYSPNAGDGGQLPKGGACRIGARRFGARPHAGNALIEFTFIMPVLLLVATGMVAFGVALHNDLMLTNAVNTGAQLLAFSRGQTSDPCATAASAISSAAPTLATGISLSFVINGTTYSSSSCPSGTTNMVQGATAQVTGTYPCVLAVSGQSFSRCSLTSQISEVIQ